MVRSIAKGGWRLRTWDTVPELRGYGKRGLSKLEFLRLSKSWQCSICGATCPSLTTPPDLHNIDRGGGQAFLGSDPLAGDADLIERYREGGTHRFARNS